MGRFSNDRRVPQIGYTSFMCIECRKCMCSGVLKKTVNSIIVCIYVGRKGGFDVKYREKGENKDSE